MDFVGDIFVVILEFIIRVLYGLLRLFIWVIGFVLSHTWLANHFDAIRRFGWWLAISMAAYLLFGIVRANVPALWTPGLTPLYQWQIVVGAMILLFVGFAMRELDPANYEASNTTHRFEPDRPVPPKAAQDKSPIQTQPTVHSSGLVAAGVLLILIVGVISAITSERHEATLAEKLCAQADARVSDDLEQTVRDGADLLDRVFGTRTADRIPCGDN